MRKFLNIEVLNWEKYNPKRDQKTYTWLRLDNGFATSADLWGLTAEQKFVWILILCQCSKKNSGSIDLTIEFLADLAKVKKTVIAEALEFLQNQGLAVVRGRDHDNARSPVVVDTTPTYERTDETNERTNEIHMSAKADAHALVGIWNSHCGELPKVERCSGNRLSQARARWKETPSTEFWTEVVLKIAASDFCRGLTGTSWRATFDWLIKPNTATKVREGTYDNRGASESAPSADKFAAMVKGASS